MDSLWRDDEAAAMVAKHAAPGEDLALRVYTSQLLGRAPALVVHGGGNTSVKSRAKDGFGESVEVLYVKGSGSDLATIGPAGFPACKLATLRRLAALPALDDEAMVRELRLAMLDPQSPTPSVEALLHAALPAKFVDHSHADAILALVDQPDAERLVREVFGPDVLFLPYVMPGFDLARAVVRALAAAPKPPAAMVLERHGLFTWGETARDAYEGQIRLVTAAEARLERTGTRSRPLAPPRSDVDRDALVARIAPVLRGALARTSGRPGILAFRASAALDAFLAVPELRQALARGTVTPDHVIRVKPRPLDLRLDFARDEAAWAEAADAALAAFAADYRAYVERGVAARGPRTPLDPWPRVVLVPGLGAFAAGPTKAAAEASLDVLDHAIWVVDRAEALGTYAPVTELDLFDVEYWSLEQAKLAKSPPPSGPLAGRVALLTGAAAGIGLATVRAFLDAGAHVVVTDRAPDAVATALAGLGSAAKGRVLGRACDVTKPGAVEEAFAAAARAFGGVDVVVSNAGAVFQGGLHTEAGHAALQRSLEVNFAAHQEVARVAARVFERQGRGGCLLFNASKSAFNPGADFGPYAVAKAAVLALMRQYAVDLGPRGVRANAVNADRIRTDLFGAGVLEQRAAARGLGVDAYFTANLLGRETTADDVARAFLYLATAEATSGCVITVDGGNAAAFPR